MRKTHKYSYKKPVCYNISTTDEKALVFRSNTQFSSTWNPLLATSSWSRGLSPASATGLLLEQPPWPHNCTLPQRAHDPPHYSTWSLHQRRVRSWSHPSTGRRAINATPVYGVYRQHFWHSITWSDTEVHKKRICKYGQEALVSLL